MKPKKGSNKRPRTDKKNTASQGIDFESALVITLFGVGYSLMTGYLDKALQFHTLIYDYPQQFIGFLLLYVILPFTIILTYICLLQKRIITPLFSTFTRHRWIFIYIPSAILKIAAIAGAPYGAFYFSMSYLQANTPQGKVYVIRYVTDESVIYPIAWAIVLAAYVLCEALFRLIVRWRASKS